MFPLQVEKVTELKKGTERHGRSFKIMGPREYFTTTLRILQRFHNRAWPTGKSLVMLSI